MPSLFILFQLLAIVASSAFVGALLFVAFVVVKFWRAAKPSDFLQWMSEHFFRFPTIMVPLNVLSLLAIISALALSWQPSPASRLPLGLGLLFLLACSITFPIYFVKANEAFVTKAVELDDVSSKIAVWSNWHWFRTGLALISTIFVGWALAIAA
ncbi:MAG: anthrone oxygenase family protein [Phormidesmis sp.]